MVVLDTLGVAYVTEKYKLRAGPLAEENWYLFAYLFQKPFFKFPAMFVGITSAFFYLQILAYRRCESDAERSEKFRILDKLHRSNLIQAIMFLVGLGLVWNALLFGHSAIKAPYSWSMASNIAYNCLTRISFSAGNFLQLFVFFLSGFTSGKAFLSRPLFLVMGKLCFITGLITPIMVQLIYSTLPDGLFVSFNKVLELGLGNVCCVMIAAFLLYLLFEFPFRRLIEYTLLPLVSHDDIYHLSHVRQKANAQKTAEALLIETAESKDKIP